MDTKTNRGRKPVKDKKRQVSVYVEGSAIDAIGGVWAMQSFFYKALERKIKTINNAKS